MASIDPPCPWTWGPRVSEYVSGGFACRTSYTLRPSYSADGRSSLPRPSIARKKRYRNINLSSIDYAFRPRLRDRLTLGGRTFPRKPWAFGDQDSHLVFRYSCLHGHSPPLHGSFRVRFDADDDALLPLFLVRGFGSGLSPDHLRRGATRPVSYYALFK